MEQVDCPHCEGTGRIPKRTADQFPVGSLVWWNLKEHGAWYHGYPGATRIPAEVRLHSKSGKRVRIMFPNLRHNYKTFVYVDPTNLSQRDADSASGDPK